MSHDITLQPEMVDLVPSANRQSAENEKASNTINGSLHETLKTEDSAVINFASQQSKQSRCALSNVFALYKHPQNITVPFDRSLNCSLHYKQPTDYTAQKVGATQASGEPIWKTTAEFF